MISTRRMLTSVTHPSIAGKGEREAMTGHVGPRAAADQKDWSTGWGESTIWPLQEVRG
jgi:hypothetical protein